MRQELEQGRQHTQGGALGTFKAECSPPLQTPLALDTVGEDCAHPAEG